MKRRTTKLIVLLAIVGLLSLESMAQSRIRFPRGRNSATVEGFLGAEQSRSYILGARRGQKMSLLLLSRGATAIVSDSSGERVEMDEDKQSMSYYFSYTGDVTITVYKPGGGATDYSLKVTIR